MLEIHKKNRICCGRANWRSINTHTSRLERFNMHLDMGWYKHEDVKCWVSKDNGADLSELTSDKLEKMLGLVRHFSELVKSTSVVNIFSHFLHERLQNHYNCAYVWPYCCHAYSA